MKVHCVCNVLRMTSWDHNVTHSNLQQGGRQWSLSVGNAVMSYLGHLYGSNHHNEVEDMPLVAVEDEGSMLHSHHMERSSHHILHHTT